jgi:hypothetical protein
MEVVAVRRLLEQLRREQALLEQERAEFKLHLTESKQTIVKEVEAKRSELRQHVDAERGKLKNEKQQMIESAKTTLKNDINQERLKMLAHVQEERQNVDVALKALAELTLSLHTQVAKLDELAPKPLAAK